LKENTQYKNAISGVQNTSAKIKSFAAEAEDQQAKQVFYDIAHNLDQAVDTLTR